MDVRTPKSFTLHNRISILQLDCGKIPREKLGGSVKADFSKSGFGCRDKSKGKLCKDNFASRIRSSEVEHQRA